MTNMATKVQWETPLCDACGSRHTHPVMERVTSWQHEGVFTIVACDRCGLIFVSPRPTLPSIGRYYEAKSYWGEDLTKLQTRPDLDKERHHSFDYLYELIAWEKPTGNIFDVGAGTGLFLSGMKEKGWEVDGSELAAAAVKSVKQRFDIALRTGDLLSLKVPEGVFDIVTLNNVLEHVFAPTQTLEKIHGMLADSGKVIITLPNWMSLGRQLYGKDWFALEIPRHLYHFTPETLTAMLEKSGFTVEHIYHNYMAHNLYVLFESFRMSRSPRFQKAAGGGLRTTNYKATFSLKKEMGKLFASLLTWVLAHIEPLLRKGEVMTVVASKVPAATTTLTVRRKR